MGDGHSPNGTWTVATVSASPPLPRCLFRPWICPPSPLPLLPALFVIGIWCTTRRPAQRRDTGRSSANLRGRVNSGPVRGGCHGAHIMTVASPKEFNGHSRHRPVAPTRYAEGRVTMRSSGTSEIRTYGCQMNMHDSERLAGLLWRRDTGAPPRAPPPTWSCSTPARSARTPTTACTATWASCSRSRTPTPACRSPWAAAWRRRTRSEITTRAPVGGRGVRHPQHRLPAGAPGAGPGAAGGAGRNRRVAGALSPRCCPPAANPPTPPGWPSRWAATTPARSASSRPFAARERPPAR